jgi:uncharacterized protein
MVIDFHTHIGDLRLKKQQRQRPVTFENMIARLDEEGIDKAVLLPIYASPEAIYPEFILGERMTIGEQIRDAARYSDRVIPFGNLDPRWLRNDPSADFGDMLDWFIEHGCRGIGEVTANIPFDDLRVVNMAQQIGARGMCMVFHGTGFEPGTYGLQDDPGSPRLERLLREAPKTNLVGHGPGFWAEVAGNLTPAVKMGYPEGLVTVEGSLPRLLRRYPNLYCDISAGSGFGGISRDAEYGVRFLNEFQDRVVFATDVCSSDPTGRMPHLGYLQKLLADGRIGQGVYDKITGGNAERLLLPA